MKFTQKYFWLIMLISLALGFVWKTPGLFLKNYLTLILMIMMTLSCLKISFSELRTIKKDWWRYFVILINIFILPTLIIYLTKNLYNQNLFIGLLVATAVPCAISVVFMSDLLDGEPSKALISTTLAHLVAPILTPCLVWLFAHQIIKVDFISMFILIGKLIIIPLLLAQILKKFSFIHKITVQTSIINTVLLLLLNWGIVAPVAYLIKDNYNQIIVISLVSLALITLQITLGKWFGRDKKEDITWSIVSMYRNIGLASVITMTTFGPFTTLGVVIYGIITNIVLAPLQWWAMRKQNTK